jgi:EmrB/QacA subfamily drug resistance transporter
VEPDPRRWFTLVIVISAVLIVALDTTVLNVAIPTMLRELDTTLPSLQWVITGYSLTFASLLVIGGRLGDLFGARRMFIVGAALFGAGSLLASVAGSVPVLVLGEAVIEGMGAALMMPATLGILSSTFHGRERAQAFGLWGATAGAAVAFGPLIGGYLTTNASWRWSFRINVIVAPLAIIGALLFMRDPERAARRERLDVPGALLVSSGMFLLVFSLSEGAIYGWWTAKKAFTVAGTTIWPADAPVSVVVPAFVLSCSLLTGFVALERWKERHRRDPLFEFGLLRNRSFRWGLLTTLILAMGQLGVLFVLPVFLQDGKDLSAVENGLWMLPSGLAIIVGTQIGARATHRVGPTAVVRMGLAFEAVGLFLVAAAVSPDATFLRLLPGLVLFGIGVGFASAQLTNVVLSDMPNARAGSASGANSTVRQLGAALGIALMGAILASRILGQGENLDAIAQGARAALLYACSVVVVGTGLSFLIPRGAARVEAEPRSRVDDEVEALEALAPLTSAGIDGRPA